MIKLVKLFFTFLNLPRLIPSLCVLVFFYGRCKGDIVVNKEHHSCNLPSVLAFMYLMTFDKWFRNLFYYRIGHVKYLISFFMPSFPSFFIVTYAKIGEGVTLIHLYATYINAVSVGDHFTIRNNVTIGNSGGG